MRIGFSVPFKKPDGGALTAREAMHRAKITEEAGFDSIWVGDQMGRGNTRPDPIMWMVLCAAATEHVEVGVAVLQVPLRRPVDLAQRLMSAHALTGGRFRAGMGAGSTRIDFSASGVVYEDRFRILNESLKIIRGLCRGEKVGDADLKVWPDTAGGPPLFIGSWGSDIWIKRAGRSYDGWLTSGGAGGNNFRNMKEGIGKYRDAGGKRALVATVQVDLNGSSPPPSDESRFTLQCSPEEARERVGLVAELGYDDLLLRGDDFSDEEMLRLAEVLGLSSKATARA
jgi:alkanesulfonate monooxygenase SsuD/methylene tetrahydromethanopterin reductase-like flavin-dependent oxidoreductase (luciferase family)